MPKGIHIEQPICDICRSGFPHKYTCDCGHIHNDHRDFSGCQIPGCKCTGYSQYLQKTDAGNVIADAIGL